MTIKRDIEVHRLFIYGLIAAVTLTVFLFQLSWTEIMDIGEDVTVVKEDVAYIKGALDRYWLADQGSNITTSTP